MSSRALRRLQREQEEQKHLKDLSDVDGSEASEEQDPVASRVKLNVFDMLEGAEADDDSEVDRKEPGDDDAGDEANGNKPADVAPESSQSKSKPKKKKKKPKKKATENAVSARETSVQKGKTPEKDDSDEIDRALRDLDITHPAQAKGNAGAVKYTEFSEWEIRVSKLLAAEQKNLNPVNEMKSLFGNVALERENNPLDRRNPRHGEAVDLGTALLGRYSSASKGAELGTLSAARNCFLQGKPEWPRATSGGLSMELKSDREAQIRRYHFVRNAAYQNVQAEFNLCVESMQPERMIHLLQYNPYHISTLLQVSEIAKHQGDHSVGTDLLERALYTLGRSVHSTFSSTLREGLARVEFNEDESREIYLTIWRYISSLEMRGTWRTAFEWCKVLLSFNILSDPYGMTHIIDQLALRGRQHQQLIDFCAEGAFKDTWHHLPNIEISLALAHQRASSPQLARQTLARATKKYPYIICRILSELDIVPPKSIWGSQPSTEGEKLYTELYATRAKDLWNTPETTSLLVEVAETLQHYDTSGADEAMPLEISLEDARHVMLTEKPSFIALLPRKYTNLPTSSSDPIPPPNSQAARDQYTQRAPGAGPSTGGIFSLPGNLGGANWLGSVLDLFRGARTPAATDEDDAHDTAPPNPPTPAPAPTDAPTIDEDTSPGQAPPALQIPASMADIAALMRAIEQQDPETGGTLMENLPEDVRQEIMLSALQDADDDVSSTYTMDSQGDVRPSNIGASSATPAPTSSADRQATVTDVSDNEDEGTRPRNSTMPTTTADSQPPASSASSDSSDPQRTQRYLLSSGLTNLQGYFSQHGNDRSQWPDQNPEALTEFIDKLQGLRSRDREWVVAMVGQRDKNVGDILKGNI
ncbi:MAG: hypothetical protein Q9160_002555 [Pyrenula sp. 1 TL-2023]